MLYYHHLTLIGNLGSVELIKNEETKAYRS